MKAGHGMGKRPAVAKRLRGGKSRGSQAAEVDPTSHFVALRFVFIFAQLLFSFRDMTWVGLVLVWGKIY